METDIIVLYAGQYDMVDKATGQRSSGTSISYYLNTDLEQLDNTDGTKGMRPAKGSSDFNLMSKIPKAPGLYHAKMTMKVGGDGKPVLSIVDLQYLTDVKIVLGEMKPAASSAAPSSK